MGNIRLLIADDNPEIFDTLEEYFKLSGDIKVVGVARNGAETLSMVESLNPDVLLLDIMMPEIDGIGVLERLPQGEKRIKIIVASAISDDRTTARALSLGAKYYIIKPYILEDLAKRIHMVMDSVKKSNLHEVISSLLMDLDMPTKLDGYKYSVEAIKILLSPEGGNCPMVKYVYEKVSKMYETNPSNVEVTIRNAIAQTHARRAQLYVEFFGVKEGDKRPTNSRFLSLLCEKIKLRGTLWDAV